MGNSAASLLLSSTKTVLAVLLCDIYRPALECVLECVFVDRPVYLIDIALLPLLRYPWDRVFQQCADRVFQQCADLNLLVNPV